MNRVAVVLLMVCVGESAGAAILPWLFTSIDTAPRQESHYDPYHTKKLCNHAHICQKNEFCDLHYGVCRQRLAAGVHCRQDSMCARGLLCMFGVCVMRVDRGKEGARCHKESDCGPGMCCARKNGERVCQLRLPLGTTCFVPEGGPDYVINELCPCQKDLICKYTSPMPPPEEHPERFWATYESLRCVPPSHSPHTTT